MPSSRRKTLRLICWNESDAAARAQLLRGSAFHVIADPPESAGGMVRYFRELAPDVVVIDLDRLPSHGRELGVALRVGKSTCQLPLVFAGGAPGKVALLQTALPDAICAAWDDIDDAIVRAMKQPAPARLRTREPAVRFDAEALARKLDIKPQTRFAIVSRESEFDSGLSELLASLPEGALLQRRMDTTTTLALFPVATRRELMHAFEQARAALPPAASLWIVHPKQTSRLTADFNQNDVREAGLASGFVDYKVCAVDKDWSGLKFARRGVTKAQPHTMR